MIKVNAPPPFGHEDGPPSRNWSAGGSHRRRLELGPTAAAPRALHLWACVPVSRAPSLSPDFLLACTVLQEMAPFCSRGLAFTGTSPFSQVFTERGLYPRNLHVCKAELAQNAPFSPRELLTVHPLHWDLGPKRGGQTGPPPTLRFRRHGNPLTPHASTTPPSTGPQPS